MNRAVLIIIFLILQGHLVNGQNYYVKSVDSNTDEYSFPKLSGGNDSICNLINRYLLYSNIELPLDFCDSVLIDSVWVAINKYQTQQNKKLNGTYYEPISGVEGLFSYKYIINSISSKLYSVTIIADWCGATCGRDMRNYNFDLTNGTLIQLDSLLTKTSKEQVIQDFKAYKIKTLQNKIGQISDTLILNNFENNYDKEYYIAQKRLYGSCLSYAMIESFDISDYYIEDSRIVLKSYSCYHDGYLDVLGEYIYTLDVKTCSGLLSEYGLDLITKNNANND